MEFVSDKVSEEQVIVVVLDESSSFCIGLDMATSATSCAEHGVGQYGYQERSV